MALSINRLTDVIDVPQADLSLISGTLFELDTNQFRKDLNAIDASEAGIVFDKTHVHNTEVTVAGTTFARTVEILSPYSVNFTPDSQYSVRLVNSNNNIFDVENGILVQNQVQLISNNSAGLIVTVQGSGVTAQDVLDIAAAVWNSLRSGHVTLGTFGHDMEVPLDAGTVPTVEASGTFIRLALTASSANDFYEGSVVHLVGGTGAGQHRPMRDYVGVTRRADIYPDWDINPDLTTKYVVVRGRVTTSVWGGDNPGGVNPPGAGLIPVLTQAFNNDIFDADTWEATGLTALADAVWDKLSANPAASSYGALMDLIQKLLRNKTVTDPVAGTITVFDDDGVAILFVTNIFEDAAGTVPYKGEGIDRRDRHT